MTDKEKLEKVKVEIKRRYDKIIALPIGKDEQWEAIMGAKAATLHSLLSFIDSMQEESKVCMYSTANYTNADRLTLCKDCKELCKYNQKTAAESFGISQEAYNKIVDKCLYGSEVELVNNGDLPKEEPVSEDLEEVIRKYEQRLEKENPATEAYDFAGAIRFGANWQKQKDAEAINENALLYSARLEGIEIGKAEMKQQLMTRAIDAQCFGFQGAALFSFRLPADKYLVGSEVKVIVIKED